MMKHGIGDDAVDTFVSIARQYREAIETRDPDDLVSFLRSVQPLLPALCHAALSLPALDEIGLPDGTEPVETHEEDERLTLRWRSLCEALIADLGADADYWEVTDPYDLSDPVQGSLADDLADVFIGGGSPTRTTGAAT